MKNKNKSKRNLPRLSEKKTNIILNWLKLKIKKQNKLLTKDKGTNWKS